MAAVFIAQCCVPTSELLMSPELVAGLRQWSSGQEHLRKVLLLAKLCWWPVST